jgi:tripartite-type tricarboxylate transporter receptor subunit TctC
MTISNLLRSIVAFCCALPVLQPVMAQGYPDKPIRIIVPTTPGGPTDVLARLLGERLRTSLGQTAVIDNRGGAGGAIGARAVAQAPADGYTLLFGNTATLATIPAVSKGAGYDPSKAFAAVAKVMDSYQVLVVAPDLPVNSVAELLAYAKANPGKLNFSTAGIGNLTHLSGELLRSKAGIDFVPVHYRSGAESLNGVLSGQAHLTIDNITAVRALVQEKRLRALAVTSASRKPEFPELPTMIEAGVPDYVVTSFFGVVAPAGTPPAIISKLNGVINEGLKSESMLASLKRLGAQPANEAPEPFQSLIVNDTKKWNEIATTAKIQLE